MISCGLRGTAELGCISLFEISSPRALAKLTRKNYTAMTTMHLTAENSKLASLVPGVYYVLQKTDHWKIEFVTKQTRSLFGYSPDEVLAMSNFFETIVYRDDMEIVQHRKFDSIDENTLCDIEFRIRTKAGDINLMRDTYTCYRNDAGLLIMEGYIAENHQMVIRDRLFHQLQAYRNAVDVNMISSITDKTGKIIYANGNFCAISKYKAWELIGKNHRILNSGTHDQKFFKDLWNTISSGHTWYGEIRNRAKDGTLYWCETVILPIFDENKKIVNYLSLRMRIDDKKRAEEQRRNYTEMLERIAFMVAHDVRGPLCRILGLTNLLLHYGNTLAEMKQELEFLDTAAVDLEKVTHKLSQFVNEHELEVRPLDITLADVK